ncbi:MAG TPA: YceI family protein [Bryobacteraceae bacterium]|nr:YceI family protein [Bryobacteraceae bacterium]
MRRPTPVCLATLLIVPTGLCAQEGAWRIDSNHSAAYFSVRHLMISTVRGEFSGINGVMRFNPKRPTEARVEATIDCSTLNSGVAARDAQMKGPDFFDVKKYPVMKFVSTRVEEAGQGKLRVAGDLTINATTRPVVLEVEGPSEVVKDARGREKVGLSAATKINRKEWGIVWNEVLETGGLAVADEVSISLDIEFIRE